MEKGWNGIGYHFVIKLDGEIEVGRPIYWIGSHAWGHNRRSIGICLIGTDKFTPEQNKSLRKLINELQELEPIVKVMGHNEISNRICPGFNVQEWLYQPHKKIDSYSFNLLL